MKTDQGFTLIEIVLVIAMISIIAGLTVPVYLSFQSRQEIEIAIVQVAQTLRRAQALSQASQGDTSWGIYVQDTILTLYKGASYGSRDQTYDEDFTMPKTVTVSGGVQDVVFNKFSGQLTANVTITLVSENNATKTILVNKKGTVSY